MANLSLESLPLGFRFSPTDEELINHYLRLKNEGHNSEVQVIAEVDFYKFDPWELPGTLFFFPDLFYVSPNIYLPRFFLKKIFLAVSFRLLFVYGFLFYFWD